MRPKIMKHVQLDEPTVNDDEIVKPKDHPDVRHRCLPAKIIQMLTDIKGHSEENNRLNRIKAAGFGVVIDLCPLRSIPQFFLRFSVDRFIEDGCCFRMDDGKILRLTEEDVSRVYGLPRGERVVNLKQSTQEARNKLFDCLKIPRAANTVIVPASLFEVAFHKEQSEDCWFKAAILYIMGCLFCPRAAPRISFKYADILEKHLNELHTYNWCQHLLKHTAKSLGKKDSGGFYKANFHFLLYNYLDHLGLECCLYIHKVQTPTCKNYGDLIETKRDLACISRIVGLGSAVKVGLSSYDEAFSKVTKDKTTFSYFNPQLCPPDKVIEHRDSCLSQISVLNDHVKLLNQRIRTEILERIPGSKRKGGDMNHYKGSVRGKIQKKEATKDRLRIPDRNEGGLKRANVAVVQTKQFLRRSPLVSPIKHDPKREVLTRSQTASPAYMNTRSGTMSLAQTTKATKHQKPTTISPINPTYIPKSNDKQEEDAAAAFMELINQQEVETSSNQVPDPLGIPVVAKACDVVGGPAEKEAESVEHKLERFPNKVPDPLGIPVVAKACDVVGGPAEKEVELVECKLEESFMEAIDYSTPPDKW